MRFPANVNRTSGAFALDSAFTASTWFDNEALTLMLG
jgi:hypothetical protein